MQLSLIATLTFFLALVAAQENPQPSTGGMRRRALRTCEYTCPSADNNFTAIVVESPDDDNFICTYGAGNCAYHAASGVLVRDNNAGACRQGATPLVAGCEAGHKTVGNAALPRNVMRVQKRVPSRASRDMQARALKKRMESKKRVL
ncbi:hypothetical protein EXIGLDRAFT_161408 [Exidia glandulosa HHB12029]|uniref:Uncharacterized protein n=1 Tax=Exidia glandulosa HHB12029 TaxID=1314781 RepID=A0A165FGK0_EXIGL|nr:hypothetical protein EXIGLDRAFT_161408 [Exidia glandulosa HHB12029]